MLNIQRESPYAKDMHALQKANTSTYVPKHPKISSHTPYSCCSIRLTSFQVLTEYPYYLMPNLG